MRQLFKYLMLRTRIFLGTLYLNNLYDLSLHKEFSDRKNRHPNPINQNSVLNGFSQHEEDSITLEILERIGLRKGYFVEFGVGEGLENNTLVLLASNWKGAWFGGQELAFDVSASNRLDFEKAWITKENILGLYSSLQKDVDVISLDLDGNDFHLVEELLSNNVNPKLFIVEYNAKFPPQINFEIDYNPSHNHQSETDDYFGASLKSFNSLFSDFGYRLVCCNLSGANAFFIKTEFSENFSDIPIELNKLYCEPFYFLRSRKMYPISFKTIAKIIN